MLPTDRRFRELFQSRELAAFTYHWLQKRDEDTWSRLSKILGVTWTQEDLQAYAEAKKAGKGQSQSSDLFIPLAQAINPSLLDSLTKDTSTPAVDGYQPEPGETIEELGNMSKNDFLNVAGRKPRK